MASIAELLGISNQREIEVGDKVQFDKSAILIDDRYFAGLVKKSITIPDDCYHLDISKISYNVYFPEKLYGEVIFIADQLCDTLDYTKKNKN